MTRLTPLIVLGALAIGVPSASATEPHIPPPLTSLKVCTMFPAQTVESVVGAHTLPSASYNSGSVTTASGYATCFYRFSPTKYLAIELYGPAKIYPTTVGTKVPQLGPTGRVQNAPPSILVYCVSHGYQVTLSDNRSAVSKAAIIKLAVYVTQHLP
jgi:hypothetical protein